jgi:hypothetical protein
MLIAAFIFVTSIGAMIQFVALAWRSSLLQVASGGLALVPGFDIAASSNLLKIQDFEDVAEFQRLSPNLGAGSAPKLRSVSFYHRFLQLMEVVMPSGSAGGWAEREMALCTQYAAVVLSHQFANNQALASDLRSY